MRAIIRLICRHDQQACRAPSLVRPSSARQVLGSQLSQLNSYICGCSHSPQCPQPAGRAWERRIGAADQGLSQPWISQVIHLGRRSPRRVRASRYQRTADIKGQWERRMGEASAAPADVRLPQRASAGADLRWWSTKSATRWPSWGLGRCGCAGSPRGAPVQHTGIFGVVSQRSIRPAVARMVMASSVPRAAVAASGIV